MKSRNYITSLLSITMVLCFTSTAFAQGYSTGLKRELEDVEALYPKRSKANTTAGVQEVQVNAPQIQLAQEPQAAPQAAQPIYIIQQPTTNVDATAVKETRAEVLRKQREEVERQNEMKLIEKLEDDRLNAEKERMEKLHNGVAPQVAQPAPVVEQKTQFVEQTGNLNANQSQGPVPVIVVNQPETANVTAAQVAVAEAKKDQSKFIIGPILGISNYPSISNVSGVYSIGGSGEWVFTDNKFSVSADVIFSSFDIKNAYPTTPYYYYPTPGTPIITTMNQWNGGSTLKYRFGDGSATLRPFVGTYVGYTRRNYSARVSWGVYNESYTGSNAFDGGLLGGFAVRASDMITLGGEFRYIWNFSYRTDDPLAYGVGGYTYVIGSPIESLNYYTVTLNLRITL
ncbi:MAG: hypothetical protein IPM57_02590 [Oligoflexia bacterium]|nr:hypothetical protein [Oligoflexia bacterium]